jgi:2-polyprenyl-3-methyl-5-hydroxy-6-metoxy-1,4-benzoquinol methylase
VTAANNIVLSCCFLLLFTFCAALTTVTLLPHDASANTLLFRLLQEQQQQQQASTSVQLSGFVFKRRALGASLVFLDIIPCKLPCITRATDHNDDDDDSGAAATIPPVQALLRREFWKNDDDDDEEETATGTSSTASFDIYHKILQPGTHVLLTGRAGPSRIPGQAVVFVTKAQYCLPNLNPQHMRAVLQFIRDGSLPWSDVQQALSLPNANNTALYQSIMAHNNKETCGELAYRILEGFPSHILRNPSHLMGASNAQKVALLPPVPLEFVTPPLTTLSIDASLLDDNFEVPLSVAKVLQSPQKNFHDGTIMTVQGWVQNRRRFQQGVTVIELVDNFTSMAPSLSDNESFEQQQSLDNVKITEQWKERLYCVLHPKGMVVPSTTTSSTTRNPTELADIYGNILSSGARVLVQGYMTVDKATPNRGNQSPLSRSSATFWVTKCRLLRSSWRPSVIRHLLDCLHDGKFEPNEAATALNLKGGYAQAVDIAKGTMDATQRQWMTTELSQELQGEHSRTAHLTPVMQQSLDIFQEFRIRYPIEQVDTSSFLDDFNATAQARQILQSNGTALRKSPKGSRWQSAKKPQLEWMMQQIKSVLRSHPEYGKRKLKVVDIGGGKGLLSNLLAESYESDVEVQVVDISLGAIRNGMMRAMRRGLENIHYAAQDATTLDVSHVDVVVALHACGALTDVALGHAAKHGAGFLIVPCCFRSNPHLRVPVWNGDLMHPALVTAEQWLGVNSTEYDALKQVAELQGDIQLAAQAMHTICGLRATAVQKAWRGSERFPTTVLSTSIKSFPIGFSTRNFCLVGKYQIQSKAKGVYGEIESNVNM